MKELLRDKRFFVPAIIFSLAKILYLLSSLLYALFDNDSSYSYYIVDLLASFLVSSCVLITIMFSILKIQKKSIHFSIAALFIRILSVRPKFLSSLSLFIEYPDRFFDSRISSRFLSNFVCYILPLLILLIFSVIQSKSARIRKLFILIPFSLRVCLTIARPIGGGAIFRDFFSLIIVCCIYYYERHFFSHEYRIKDAPHVPVSYLEQYKQKLKKG